MTLKSQLITLLKEDDCIYSGFELEKMTFYTRRNGTYKPSTISRELRLLSEPEEETGERPRLLKSMRTGYIRYKYNESVEEKFNKSMK